GWVGGRRRRPCPVPLQAGTKKPPSGGLSSTCTYVITYPVFVFQQIDGQLSELLGRFNSPAETTPIIEKIDSKHTAILFIPSALSASNYVCT
ncbi:hypothetical protein NX865_30065, partial [Burkholderia thailandensis]|uniref:hypothetical protein n=1 Tax=Burkholderia thailandensis TaxID=57975 RepID=UPI00217EE459